MKSILPIILIVASIGLFFFKVSPLYSDVKDLRTESADYDKALEVADQLKTLRSDLRKELDSFSEADMNKLDHFLPTHLDTVRIILDVDGIASQHGIKLKDPKINDQPTTAAPATGPNGTPIPGGPLFSTVALGFTFTSTYAQARDFLADVEKSLRILDNVNIGIRPNPKSDGLYDFTITLNTYWVNR